LALASSALDHAEGVDAQIGLWQDGKRRTIEVSARRFARTENGDFVLFTLAHAPRAQTSDSTPANPIADLLGSFPLGLAIFTTGGRCIYGNRAFERLLGRAQGLSFADLAGSARAGERLARNLLGAGSVRVAPTITREGTDLTLQIDAAVIADPIAGQTAFLVQAQDVSARRGYERQLGERFTLMKSLLEAVVEGWIILTPALRVRTLGGALFDEAGSKADGAIGLSWEDALPPLGIEMNEALTEAIKSRTSAQIALSSEPGRLATAMPRWSDEGEFLGYQIALASTPSAAPARETGSGPARMIDLGTVALIGHDNFEIAYANERAAQLFGAASPDSLIGRPFLDFFATDEKRASEHYDQLNAETKEVATPSLRAERLDGSAIIVDAEFRRAHLFGKELVLASFHDVTHLAGAAQPQIITPTAWLDTIPVALVLIDNKGRVTQANAQAQSLLKLAAGEADGRPFDEFIDRDDRAAYAIRRAAAASMAPGLIATLEARLKPRPEISIAAQLALRPASGNDGLMIAITSLEAREERQARLQRALDQTQDVVRQKTEFLSAISHEMRTPLNAIIGFSEFMREGRLGPIGNEKYAGYVDDIHMSGLHLLSLVNDLLDMSKLEAGRYELDFTPIAVEDVVDQALRMIRPSADKKGVLLIRQLGGVPPVMADLRSVKQILLNLLSNAVKFTPSPGSVTIKTTHDMLEGVRIEVSDTGIGMAPRDLERALEPYAQVHQRHANDEPGTGLGLPLAKALTEANHAQFTIESTEGKGTRVSIVFPAAQVTEGAIGSA
ncbi:MAG TPA: ATP-binding protein, partial [Alphaproteobacteria bacterium]|nr:ATP-binding protein [Alphaproteobacteria bacterium]